jgi:hypothetical protein
MEFAPPLYISSVNAYKSKINECDDDYIYESRTSVIPDITTTEFIKLSESIIEKFTEFHQEWFPSTNICKESKHLWCSPVLKKGKKYSHFWKPTAIYFGDGILEIQWKVFDSTEIVEPPPEHVSEPIASDVPPNFEIPNSAPEPMPAQTQPPPPSGSLIDQMIELDAEKLPPCSSDTPSQNIYNPTREKLRKRLDQARLSAAFAQVKASRLAKDYYEKYGTFDISDSEGSEEFE